jgi:hypothetical protein
VTGKLLGLGTRLEGTFLGIAVDFTAVLLVHKAYSGLGRALGK